MQGVVKIFICCEEPDSSLAVGFPCHIDKDRLQFATDSDPWLNKEGVQKLIETLKTFEKSME